MTMLDISPFLPVHSSGKGETKHQCTGFHPQVSISQRVWILNLFQDAHSLLQTLRFMLSLPQ